MRDGVPRLLDVMAAEGVKATFYLSMGPDRSGLAVLNALRPGFLASVRVGGGGDAGMIRAAVVAGAARAASAYRRVVADCHY